MKNIELMKLMPIKRSNGCRGEASSAGKSGFSFLYKNLNLLGASPFIGDDASDEHAYLPLCRRAVIV